ncbi:MAG: hypothetical protein ACE5EO_11425 [Candidatus Krumholzibacteriia bacterium]
MLTICPTADYEIYLGKNHLPLEDVLFEPTRKLLEVWGEFGVRGTLFPDICSVWRHRELAVPGYADEFENQIKDAAAAGHDVQLHLHPEWTVAEYRDGSWRFQPHTHALHDLGFAAGDPAGARALIRRGKQYLEGLLGGDDPGYHCVAFRAGGWLIQPEAEVVSALLAEGLRVDATATPGLRLLRRDYAVDFRKVPDRPAWFVHPKTGLALDTGSTDDLLEISIASYRGRFPQLQHVVNQLRLRRRAKAIPEESRGYPVTRLGPRPGFVTRIHNKFTKLSVPRMLETADTHESMLATLRSYLRRYDCRHEDMTVCMSGHPKDTYDYHLLELRKFLDVAKTRYGDIVRFQTISQCAGRLLPGE